MVREHAQYVTHAPRHISRDLLTNFDAFEVRWQYSNLTLWCRGDIDTTISQHIL